MDKKIIGVVGLLIILSLSIFVYANSQSGEEDNLTFSIDVNEGWNLLAGGVFAMNPNSDSQIKQEDISAIFFYDNVDNKYIRIFPNGEESILQDYFDSIDDSAGDLGSASAWVYINKKGTLSYTTDDSRKVEDRQLRKGWNFFSITFEMGGKSLNDLKGNCNIEKAHWWGGSNWEQFSLDRKIGSINSEIVGTGLLLKLSSDCKMGESLTEIPSLPEENNECTDTDGGLDYYVQGYVLNEKTKYTDKCVSKTFEDSGGYSKQNGEWYEIKSECSGDNCYIAEAGCNVIDEINNYLNIFQCPNGCENGACI